MLRYDELQLRLECSASGNYVVAARSPVGSSEGTFRLPFSDDKIELFVLRMAGQPSGRLGLETVREQQAEDFGRELFEALFQGEVRQLYRDSRTRADKARKGLRITLELAGAPALANIPWEYLFDGHHADPLALGVQTPITRKLAVPDPRPVLKIKQPPLRVLGMVSSPADHEQLDVPEQRGRLEDALRDLLDDGLVEVEWCETATLRELNRRLSGRSFHVFHYCGHGAYDAAAEDGVLLFEGPGGNSDRVTGRKLGLILREQGPQLRLTVLNACEGARAAREDPFAGVAAALVRRSMPAVVAMQFDIKVEAAGEFTEHFYKALAEGNQVDTAVVYGRLAIHAYCNGGVEWATPVLFLQVADGRIFDDRWRSPREIVQKSPVRPVAVRERKEPHRPPATGAARPVALPQLTGVELACVHRAGSAVGDLGTDFHVVVQRGASECAIVVGQLSGMAAEHEDAKAQAEGAVRTAASTGCRAHELLGAVNRALVLSSPTDGTWSVACALVRTQATTEAELAWGGPPPAWYPWATPGPRPLLVRADGSVHGLVTSRGSGELDGNGGPVDQSVKLDAGDALVLCTQDVYGRTGARESNIARLLERARRGPDGQTGARLATALCEDGADPQRDMSVLVVRAFEPTGEEPHVIALHGAIDLGKAIELKTELEDAAPGDATCVIIDMSDVENLDSTALDFIVSATHRQRHAGGDLRIVAGHRLSRMFRIPGVEQLIDVYRSRAAAREGLPRAR